MRTNRMFGMPQLSSERRLGGACMRNCWGRHFMAKSLQGIQLAGMVRSCWGVVTGVDWGWVVGWCYRSAKRQAEATVPPLLQILGRFVCCVVSHCPRWGLRRN
jgi:hypothetical protein